MSKLYLFYVTYDVGKLKWIEYGMESNKTIPFWKKNVQLYSK